MRKSEMNSLVAGVKIQSKKDSTVYEIVGMDAEAGKYILTNGKTYSTSTMIRWFDLYVESLVDEQDNTEEQTNTSDLQDTDTQDDQLHDDTEQTTKKDIVEGNTTTPGQQIFENSISGVVIQHGCHLNRMKEYVKVGKQGYKGCLVYIRTARDKSWKFDVSKKTWNKLTSEYQTYLIEQYGASIVDSSRGLWRIANCKELDVFEVLLLTALKIA